MSKPGFIGLGIMGAPMALHLVDASHALFVNTRGRLPEAIAASSAVACASGAEVADQADIVFTMVPDTPDVELGVALPQTAGAAQLMQACPANGMAGLGHSALVRALEPMASHEVAEA